MNRPPHADYYSEKAKKDNYPARSAYKLQELDDKFHIFRTTRNVLDLGASPGSWTMVATERLPPHAKIVSCDLKPLAISTPSNVQFFQENIFERTPEFSATLEKLAPFDVIMSDMAPNTTGSHCTDAARSLALCEEALYLALEFLAPTGIFITKIFMGGDIQGYQKTLREHFTTVKCFKPKSSKKESKETFYIGIGRKPLL